MHLAILLTSLTLVFTYFKQRPTYRYKKKIILSLFYTDAPGFTPFYVPEVGTEYSYGHIYVYIQGKPVEMQTPTHWKFFGSGITAPPPLLSPSSILSSPLPRCTIVPARKNTACCKNVTFF
jgi:hypothetical protein